MPTNAEPKPSTSSDSSEEALRLERIFHPYTYKQTEEFFKKQGGKSQARFVHYTSAYAALRIIQTKRLWMRNVTSMSDYSEVQHGFNVLNTIISEPKNRKAFNDALDECSPRVGEDALGFFNQFWTDIRWNTYVTSISEHYGNEDAYGRLSMWRAFGGTDVRVALVFRVPPSAMNAGVFELIFSPVAYLEKEEVESQFIATLTSVGENSEFLKSLDRNHLVRLVFQMLVAGVTCLKHPGFKEEREWRLIYAPKRWPSKLIEPSTETIRGIPQILYNIPFDSKVAGVPPALEFAQLFDRLIIGPAQFPWSTVQAFTSSRKRVLRFCAFPKTVLLISIDIW